MKTTITRTVLATLFMLLSFAISSYAQYHHVYLCDNATAKLHTQEEAGLANGDKVHWYLEGVEVTGSPFTFNGTAGSTDFTVPGTLAVGLHKYTTAIESAGGCLGDKSDAYEIYKLPTKTLALTKTVSTYCGASSGAVSGSVITATTTPAATLPAGFEYAYTWTITEGGNPATPGSSDGSVTATNVYTMNTTTAGTYIYNATVKYVKTAANTGVFIAGDTNGCQVTAAATQTVVVTPKPGKPTIMLAN